MAPSEQIMNTTEKNTMPLKNFWVGAKAGFNDKKWIQPELVETPVTGNHVQNGWTDESDAADQTTFQSGNAGGKYDWYGQTSTAGCGLK